MDGVAIERVGPHYFGGHQVRPEWCGAGNAVVDLRRWSALGPLGTVPTSPYWALASAGFAPSGADEWWGLVEGASVSPEVTSDEGGTWRAEPRFPLLNQVQVLNPHLIVGWQQAGNEKGRSLMISDDGGAHWWRRPSASHRHPGPGRRRHPRLRERRGRLVVGRRRGVDDERRR